MSWSLCYEGDHRDQNVWLFLLLDLVLSLLVLRVSVRVCVCVFVCLCVGLCVCVCVCVSYGHAGIFMLTRVSLHSSFLLNNSIRSTPWSCKHRKQKCGRCNWVRWNVFSICWCASLLRWLFFALLVLCAANVIICGPCHHRMQ